VDTPARSIRYQMTVAKLPLAKNIEEFDFTGTPINDGLVRELANGSFVADQRNVVLIGGTGTGKTHLAIAIARALIAKYALALRRISFAWRNSRFSRSKAFIRSAISLETPGRLPLSTSAFLTQSFRVCGAQPIFAEIDMTACQRDPCWPSLSRTSRTARSRTSAENLFVVLLMMLHPTQELEPPANPARFMATAGDTPTRGPPPQGLSEKAFRSMNGASSNLAKGQNVTQWAMYLPCSR
jgi:IstB-like ATP binding protein